MIPSEPDPDNTGEGKRRTFSFCVFARASRYVLILAIMPEVFINQDRFQLRDGGVVTDVLLLLHIERADGIAVAVNEVVIPRKEWTGLVLQEQDRVFVIRATQGG